MLFIEAVTDGRLFIVITFGSHAPLPEILFPALTSPEATESTGNV